MVNDKTIMGKRIIITEDEKNDIKLMYNIVEQSNFFKDLATSTLDALLSTGNSEGKESKKATNVSEKGQELLNNPIFKEKLTEISNAIGIDENSIIKLMNHESTLDPTIENNLGCVGLIQFCPDSKGGTTKTINREVYNLEELKNNLELQMDAIKDFWLLGKKSGKIKSALDLYVYNILPDFAGVEDKSVILKYGNVSAEKFADKNPIFNSVLGRKRDTPLTLGDLETFYKKQGMV